MMNHDKDEESLLLVKETEQCQTNKWSLKSKVGGALVTAAFFFSAAYASNNYSKSTSLLSSQQLSTTSSKYKLIVNRNGYDEVSAHTRSTVYDIDYIVEPDAEMILKVKDCEYCDDLKWSIETTTSRGSVTYDDTETSNTLTATFTDSNSVYLVKVRQNDLELFSAELTCKYVRRELRTINDDDLESYFKALKIMYTTNQEDGVSTYGTDFHSYSHLTALHNSLEFAYHGNLFFTTSHPVMQIKFEKSLLSINKNVILNYWDFMKDSELGRKWADSEIYSEKMFGTTRTVEADNYRVNGYFHDVKYVYDPDETIFPEASHNPHGFLGNAQMTSGSSYLQRSNSYCGLESVEGQVSGKNLLGCFDSFKTDSNMREFDICLEEKVHANLHMMHAGQWDCAVSWSDFHSENKEWVDEMFLSIVAVSMSTMTQIYAANGFVSCPSSLTGTETKKCASSISGVKTADDVDTQTMNQKFLLAQDAWSDIATKSVGAQDYLIFMKEYVCDGTTYNDVWLPADTKGPGATGTAMDNVKLDKLNTLILKTILFQGNYGIMMSGAAVNDPLFWVMHPMFDKALQALRLSPNYNSNGFEWNNIKGDLKYEAKTPFKKADFEPFASLESIASLNEHGYLKNSEIWELLEPNSGAIGYIYDQFLEWGNVKFDPFAEMDDDTSN